MRAAKNFTYGKKGAANAQYRVGDDIPDDVIGDLDDSLILEKVAKVNPDALTREQLMVMAGLDQEPEGEIEVEVEDAPEDEFREGMSEIKTKGELAAWAEEFFGLEVDTTMTREEMEDFIADSKYRPEGE